MHVFVYIIIIIIMHLLMSARCQFARRDRGLYAVRTGLTIKSISSSSSLSCSLTHLFARTILTDLFKISPRTHPLTQAHTHVRPRTLAHSLTHSPTPLTHSLTSRSGEGPLAHARLSPMRSQQHRLRLPPKRPLHHPATPACLRSRH